MRLELIVGTAAVAFVSTNIDDLFVLLAFMGDRRLTTLQVVAGQYFGIGSITLISIVAASQAFRLPSVVVHILGILPIALGLWRLWQLHGEDDITQDQSLVRGALTVAMVTISNSADNVAVYVPLFAKFGNSALATFSVVFAVLTGVLCLVTRSLHSRKAISAFVDKWGHRIMPFALMALGLYILFGS